MITIRMADGKTYKITADEFERILKDLSKLPKPASDCVLVVIEDWSSGRGIPMVINLKYVVVFEGDPTDDCEMWKAVMI